MCLEFFFNNKSKICTNLIFMFNSEGMLSFSDFEIEGLTLIKYGVSYDPPAIIIFYEDKPVHDDDRNQSPTPLINGDSDGANVASNNTNSSSKGHRVRKRKMPLRDLITKDCDVKGVGEKLRKKHPKHLQLLTNYKLEKMLTLIQGRMLRV